MIFNFIKWNKWATDRRISTNWHELRNVCCRSTFRGHPPFLLLPSIHSSSSSHYLTCTSCPSFFCFPLLLLLHFLLSSYHPPHTSPHIPPFCGPPFLLHIAFITPCFSNLSVSSRSFCIYSFIPLPLLSFPSRPPYFPLLLSHQTFIRCPSPPASPSVLYPSSAPFISPFAFPLPFFPSVSHSAFLSPLWSRALFITCTTNKVDIYTSAYRSGHVSDVSGHTHTHTRSFAERVPIKHAALSVRL